MKFLIISDYESYDQLRKITCKELGLTYRPDPIIEPHTVREVFLPEDKLKAGMKERIVASLVNEHEICEEQVGLRLKFEDKIKRPYFHVRPLDLKQLKNWDAYLDFEIGKFNFTEKSTISPFSLNFHFSAQGNHERIVVLFERCLIPCSRYEQFWAKYAQYLEDRMNKGLEQNNDQTNAGAKFKPSSAGAIRKAKWSFGTGLTNVEDIRERR